MSNSKFCRDSINGMQCCCEFFSEPVDSTAPRVCRECGHGFSKHPNALVAIQNSQEQASGLQPGTSGRHRILEVFNKQASSSIVKQEPASKGVTWGSRLHAAKDESLRGFRGPGLASSKQLAGLPNSKAGIQCHHLTNNNP